MGGMQLRASSVEEKKAWLAVLSNASMVRSFSSKNLEDLMGPADVELGTLRLADLHMGEVLGRERQIGGKGVQEAHLTPLGLFLKPLGLFLRTSISFIQRVLSAFPPA